MATLRSLRLEAGVTQSPYYVRRRRQARARRIRRVSAAVVVLLVLLAVVFAVVYAGSPGTIAEGMAADLLLIDRDHLSTPDAPRYARDFPANSGRYVVDADGYRAVIVNGETLLDDGTWTGATPGEVIRA